MLIYVVFTRAIVIALGLIWIAVQVFAMVYGDVRALAFLGFKNVRAIISVVWIGLPHLFYSQVLRPLQDNCIFWIGNVVLHCPKDSLTLVALTSNHLNFDS